ncbi:porin family protein [Microbacter margulisiae]|uniref:Outer membrane protein beta-barrel domain-containing protein n=1 Tax=Microbacter margulisiae TaxID=1350067 RepID=A0A7W5DSW0_9PORP|nr:porin family protein [Microbacter margulisiae]MBB3188452.1 hypothetical protein [Microbacter margulisiae]
MKKLIILSLILFSGQLLFAQMLSIGVKAGYEAASGYNEMKDLNLSSNVVNELKSGFANGVQVGGWMRIGAKQLYLQPEVLFDFKKASQTVYVDNTPLQSSFKSNTIEVPVLLGYKLIDLKVLNLHVTTGPRFILNAGSSMTQTNSWGSFSSSLTQQVKSGNWGWQFGAGFDILALSINVDYCHYFSPATSFTLNGQTFSTSNSGHVIFLSLGWRLF